MSDEVFSMINLNDMENTPGIFEGFEIVAEQTDNLTWNGHEQGTVSISWTSDRDGYAILTKGCSIFAGYYTEVSYSITVNGTVIDNNSEYRVDVGNDVNNRVFLFPISVGDEIAATVTGNSGDSGGTLTLRLRASVMTPIDSGEASSVLNKINLNNVEYTLGDSKSTIASGLFRGFENVEEQTDNLTWNGHKQGTVSISWVSDRNGYAILTKGCSIFAGYYTEPSYNITLNTETIDNNSEYRIDVGNDVNNRVFLFPIKVGDIINATVTGNSGSSGGTLTLRLKASIVVPIGGSAEDGGNLSKINVNGVEYKLSGIDNSSKLFDILSHPQSSEFYISVTSGDSMNLAGRSFTRSSNLPVMVTNCKTSSNYHGWFLFGRTPESVESTVSGQYQAYVSYTLDSGNVIHVRYLSGGMLNSDPTFYINGSRHSLYISCWQNIVFGDLPSTDSGKNLLELADIVLPK